jgi:hypothetical protein
LSLLSKNDKPWFHNSGKTSCYTHHTFLLGFPTGWSFTKHKDCCWGTKKNNLPRQLAITVESLKQKHAEELQGLQAQAARVQELETELVKVRGVESSLRLEFDR